MTEPYTEPLFWSFAMASMAVSVGGFLLFATPLTVMAWLDPPGLRHRRIQGGRGQPGRWVMPGLLRFAVNNALMALLLVLAWPLLRQSGVHDGPWPPWYEVVASVVLFVYLDDLLYYGFHRTLHTKWLYKRVHSVHHRITTPWALTGNYMHPVEFVLTGALVLVGPLLLGSHVLTLWTWVLFRQWIAAEGHCGYALPFNPSHLFPGYGGNAFHDFHHSKFVGNYSGFMSHWDRWLGTLSEGYDAHRHAYRDPSDP